MKVLAFLQNMWVNDPEGVKRMLARHDDDKVLQARVRRRLIHYALFAGCLTGRRLKAALGEEWCSKIIWEEGSPEIGGKASSFFPPDIKHMKGHIEAEKPDAIILFGAANAAVCPLLMGTISGPILTAPHPAARGAHIPGQLKMIADRLNAWTMPYAKTSP